MKLPHFSTVQVAVIGLGYVGLPLAVEISTAKECLNSGISLNRKVIGFDISEQRITSLCNFNDITGEYSMEELKSFVNLTFTSSETDLSGVHVYIIAVPTPINASKQPDLSHLLRASEIVGKSIKRNKDKDNSDVCPVVIYESTVYPGATEEECIPALEQFSGLSCNINFVCGYSPERINPGDKSIKLPDIVKVTSGSNKEASEWIDMFYLSIIRAGTHLAPSIKVAEASKVIENTQRDLNIALINELSIVFMKMGISTTDVINAASTKWNFMKFSPGLVGGHCISVDPYYLTYKAELLGYYPEVILAGRKINDSMGERIALRVIKELVKKKSNFSQCKVLIMGFSFKENCPDTRNTKVYDLHNTLKDYGLAVDVFDPVVRGELADEFLDVLLFKDSSQLSTYDAVICAVAHRYFIEMKINQWKNILANGSVLFDVKGIIPKQLNPINL